MEYDGIVDPGEIDRYDEWTSVLHNADVTDQGLVQDAVDGFAVIESAFREAFDTGTLVLNGWCHVFVLG